ncbi:MAG TPA: arylsulfatase [Pirellulales bacterium]|nr:arylsulfatase [Pirellulales bacterium]
MVFILADDLGYGDLGCYGQYRIQTPTLDRLAADGIRFTSAYAGCTVCAPSRCTLLTGFDTGHAWIRGNSHTTLDDQPTVASMLKLAGYATCVVGKWGMSTEDDPGPPSKQGFDYFFGYMTHKDAHNYWPEFLWENDREVPLPGNVVSGGVATERGTYSDDMISDKALQFIDDHKDGPFFLYLCPTLPHANNEAKDKGMEIPSDAPYSKEDWPQPEKNRAAMITRLDSDVAKVLDRLKSLGLDERTIVFFSSDNGPHKEGGSDPAYFHSAGPLSGYKRSMTEGGIRVPAIVRWTGKIEPGQTSDLAWAFWDVMPTAAELAGVKPPAGIDGLSIVPTLLGSQAAGHQQEHHEYLYWEFHEKGFHQALRFGRWKAIRDGLKAPIALYDLHNDIGETTDLAAQHPKQVARAKQLFSEARTDSALFPVADTPTKPAAKRKKTSTPGKAALPR